jgi:hypothetical protein
MLLVGDEIKLMLGQARIIMNLDNRQIWQFELVLIVVGYDAKLQLQVEIDRSVTPVGSHCS